MQKTAAKYHISGLDSIRVTPLDFENRTPIARGEGLR